MLRLAVLLSALLFVGVAPTTAEAGQWQYHNGHWHYYDDGHWYRYHDGDYYHWSGGDWRFYAPWSRGYHRHHHHGHDGRYWPYTYEDRYYRPYDYRHRDRYRERYRDDRRFGVETPWGSFEYRRR
jgi:hypothetical protein